MPQGHHSQFKELLVMVESFGMPQFYLILTSNEPSNLRWKEIENIKNLTIFFNNTFSWKDCDAPPSSLMDSTVSPKVKTTEGEGVGVRSLAHNTLGVKGRAEALG
jgi:hypothetical protein